MNKEDIFNLVCALVKANSEVQRSEVLTESSTRLIGAKGVLDSMGLVNLIADIETSLLDEGVEITLINELSMSERLSPFRTIGTLCAYIETLMGRENLHNE